MTAEERREWRAICASWGLSYVVGVFDALDAVEGEHAELQRRWDNLVGDKFDETDVEVSEMLDEMGRDELVKKMSKDNATLRAERDAAVARSAKAHQAYERIDAENERLDAALTQLRRRVEAAQPIIDTMRRLTRNDGEPAFAEMVAAYDATTPPPVGAPEGENG